MSELLIVAAGAACAGLTTGCAEVSGAERGMTQPGGEETN